MWTWTWLDRMNWCRWLKYVVNMAGFSNFPTVIAPPITIMATSAEGKDLLRPSSRRWSSTQTFTSTACSLESRSCQFCTHLPAMPISPLSRDQNRPCCLMSGAQGCHPPASNTSAAQHAAGRSRKRDASHSRGLFLSDWGLRLWRRPAHGVETESWITPCRLEHRDEDFYIEDLNTVSVQILRDDFQ